MIRLIKNNHSVFDFSMNRTNRNRFNLQKPKIRKFPISKKPKRVILINTMNSVRVIRVSNIIMCKADGKYTRIYLHKTKFNLKSRKAYCYSSMSIGEIEKLLAQNYFFRIHRSTIINLRYFSEINSRKNTIILRNGEILNISRAKKADFKRKLFNFLLEFNKDILEFNIDIF